jgi:hypothetical protein
LQAHAAFADTPKTAIEDDRREGVAMVRKSLLACAAWATLTSAAAAQAVPEPSLQATAQSDDDFPYDHFVPATLADIARDHGDDLAGARGANLPSDKPTFNLDSRGLRYCVRVTWLGQSRPIGAYRKHLIALRFVQMQVANPDKYYMREYLVGQAGKKYWLPMQVPLEAHFAEELHVGSTVDLYLMDFGTVMIHGTNDIVLIVEEFAAEPIDETH